MDTNIIRGYADVELDEASYTGKLSVGDDVYVNGGVYLFKPDSNSVQDATLEFNSMGAKNITIKGVNVSADELIAGSIYQTIFNVDNDVFEVTIPPPASPGPKGFSRFTTTTNSVETILTIPMVSGQMLFLEFSSIGSNTSNSKMAYISKAAYVYYHDGTLHQSSSSWAGTGTTGATIAYPAPSISGSNILVKCTGETSVNIQWVFSYSYFLNNLP